LDLTRPGKQQETPLVVVPQLVRFPLTPVREVRTGSLLTAVLA